MTASAPVLHEPGLARSVLVIAVAAVAMIVAGCAAVYAAVWAAFYGGAALLAIPLLAAALAVAIAVLAKAVVGRATVVGAIAATVLYAGLAGYALTSGAFAPSSAAFWPQQLALAALCALALGVFVGPRSLRVAGIAAVVGALVFVVVQPTAAQRATQADAERHDAELSEWRGSFLAVGTFPFVTDRDGWRAVQVRATGVRAESWLVDDTGAVATVLATGPIDAAGIDPAVACSFLAREGDVGAADGLPAWCTATPLGWARTDGLAAGFTQGDRYVVLRAGESADIAQVGGSAAASPSELQDLAGSLHPMDRADVEREVLDSYSGDVSPVVVLGG